MIQHLNLVSKFFICGILFIATTLIAGMYGWNVFRLNLWVAMVLLWSFNPLKLDGLKRQIWALSGGIAGVAILYLGPRYSSVWLFFVWACLGVLMCDKENARGMGRVIIACASFFNLSFISATTQTDAQYDFLSCYNYIEYILENNFMFWRENPLLTRPSYSAYHPILHFFIASVGIKLGILITQSKEIAGEAVQVLFWMYMLAYYFIGAKILEMFKPKRGVYLACVAFLCMFPTYNAIAGFFNNDCLLLPLQAGTVYFALKYMYDGGRKNLAFLWVVSTLACLTKLSAVLVLPMVAGVLLVRLLKEKNKQTFYEEIVFGVLVLLGVAIWPMYQHFVLGVGADFVPPQEHLSLKEYSMWERYNPLGAFVYEKMFYNDFGINLWETMTKTALFGMWDFSQRGKDIMTIMVWWVVLYKTILFVSVIGVLVLIYKKWCLPELWLIVVLLLSLIAGQVMFGVMHPYMCNQDFRYVAVIVLPITMLWAMMLEKMPTVWRKVGIALLGMFAICGEFIWAWIVRF